jgi:histidinol-phosphate/aromatic aminotransferase/cobyric acid decarboxylase-like protein/GNAT superfamily N-acetyltransferase
MIPSSSPSLGAPYHVALASPADRATLYRMRHAVYATELGQHTENPAETLHDALDTVNQYIVARSAGRIVGFISVTPPNERGYSIDKYVCRTSIPISFDSGLFELRLLTVARGQRGSALAALLMYAAFRWISSQGATHAVALGRSGATVRLYEKVGFRSLSRQVQSGAVTYELMYAPLDRIRSRVRAMTAHTERLRRSCSWALPIPFEEPAGCYHGGASIHAIGDTFTDLGRADEIISADVLDAWFPPAPAVVEALRTHLPYLLRTSPPTDCAGLLRTIAARRGVASSMLVPGAGSSDLIFRAFREWLSPGSRVLLLDPTYGEYAHVAGSVIGCQVDRLRLSRELEYRVDPEELRSRCGAGYDLIVLVNPNSPTGQVISRDDLTDLLRVMPSHTRIWIDETYIDYCGPGESMEPLVAQQANLVVCKSMSKVYALSGARVAYLCAAPAVAQALRTVTPPWIVSSPAQMAAIRALDEEEYYRDHYQLTHELRSELASALRAIRGIEQVVEGVANFLLVHVDPRAALVAEVCERSRTRGLYLRDLCSMSLQDDLNAFRIAVKDARTNQRMVEILLGSLSGALVPGVGAGPRLATV